MESSASAKIEITAPRRFNLGAVLLVSAFGIFPALPVIASILAVSVLQFGLMTFLVPLAGLAAAALLVPFGFGNPYVTYLVRRMNPDAAKNPDALVVQLTLSPRLRSGLRAVLEDADDVGILTRTGGDVSFSGDSVKLTLPRTEITSVRPQNIGWRGMYVSGRRIEVVVASLPNVQSLEFAERSAWLLPTSKKITKKLYHQLTNL